jgi:hypothetical protein
MKKKWTFRCLLALLGASLVGAGCSAQRNDEPVAAIESSITGVNSFPRYIKAPNREPNDQFGVVSISGDGRTLVVGAWSEDSAATGVDEDAGDLDNSAGNSGAAYVFTELGGSGGGAGAGGFGGTPGTPTWNSQAYLKASNTGPNDNFGQAVAISLDGNTIAVGAPAEDGNATTVNGPDNNLAGQSGAVYVFARPGGSWIPPTYIKAANSGAGDNFGIAVALSADGNVLAVGAHGEDGAATGGTSSNTTRKATTASAWPSHYRVAVTLWS